MTGNGQFYKVMSLLQEISEYQQVVLTRLVMEDLFICKDSAGNDCDDLKFLLDVLESRVCNQSVCDDSIWDFLHLCIESIKIGPWVLSSFGKDFMKSAGFIYLYLVFAFSSWTRCHEIHLIS